MRNKLIINSFFSYFAYFTEAFMLYIIAGVYGDSVRGMLGWVLAIIYLSMLILPVARNSLLQRFSSKNVFKLGLLVHYLSLVLLFFVAYLQLSILLFILLAFIMVFARKIQSFEYKYLIHRLNLSDDDKITASIERKNQISIEMGYGLCLFLGGWLSINVNIAFLILIDALAVLIYAVNALKLIKNIDFSILEKPSKFSYIKLLTSKKLLFFFTFVLTGYIFFRADDTTVSYIYSMLENGSSLYGYALGIAGIFAILALFVYEKYIATYIHSISIKGKRSNELRNVLIVSILIMFSSLILISRITESTKYLIFIVAILNGTGTGLFLGNVKGYLISRSGESKDNVIMMVQVVENSLSVLLPATFMNIVIYQGVMSFVFVISGMLILWIAYTMLNFRKL